MSQWKGLFPVLVVCLSGLAYSDGGPVIESNTDPLGLFSWLIFFICVIFISGTFRPLTAVVITGFLLMLKPLGLLAWLALFVCVTLVSRGSESVLARSIIRVLLALELLLLIFFGGDYMMSSVPIALTAVVIGGLLEKRINRITEPFTKTPKSKTIFFVILLATLILAHLNTAITYDCGMQWHKVSRMSGMPTGEDAIFFTDVCHPTTLFNDFLGNRRPEEEFSPLIKDDKITVRFENLEKEQIQIKKVTVSGTEGPCNVSSINGEQIISEGEKFSVDLQCPKEEGKYFYEIPMNFYIDYVVYGSETDAPNHWKGEMEVVYSKNQP